MELFLQEGTSGEGARAPVFEAPMALRGRCIVTLIVVIISGSSTYQRNAASSNLIIPVVRKQTYRSTQT